jgi:cation-transporting P-type ATPase 13A2
VIHHVSKQSYGYPLSTIFNLPSLGIMRSDNDEDNDPILAHIRLLEYRYLRFVYNPVDDSFQSVSGWKDAAWTNTKLMRLGLDADERDNRELVFGQNIIDVQQKSTSQLLVDEV